jgi:hypothetical protein
MPGVLRGLACSTVVPGGPFKAEATWDQKQKILPPLTAPPACDTLLPEINYLIYQPANLRTTNLPTDHQPEEHHELQI